MTLKTVGRCTEFAVLTRLFVPMVAIKEEQSEGIVDCPPRVKTANLVGPFGLSACS